MNKDHKELASSLFRRNYNCAQSVLMAFSGDLGFERKAAIKLAGGFGAGIAREQNVCGAVTGAVMVLGLRFATGLEDPETMNARIREQVRLFTHRFRRVHGSIVCMDLLGGLDLDTEEGRQRFEKQNMAETTCLQCVRTACEILESLTEE